MTNQRRGIHRQILIAGLYAGICWLIVACAPIIPATTPPQLKHTPGVAISLDDDRIFTADYALRYPEGWRVIKNSVAAAPLQITFASPDDRRIIIVSNVEISVPDTLPDDAITRQATVTFEEESTEAKVYLFGYAPEDVAGAFREQFDAVQRSIQPND